jgi:hypothetical protein
MELCEKACEEILETAMVTFDTVNKMDGNLTDWRSIFEAAFSCILSLKDTEAIMLFATMCICALDFETYSDLEDNLLNRSKEIPMLNTLRYMQLSKSIDEQ